MDITNRCTTVADAARAAEDWLGHPDNADLVGGEARLVRHELRRGAMRARKLGRAAGRRMAISVFGPSQAGKSFLVSVLARPASGQLTSNFPDPGGKLDFISQVNPEGEGESTGIVTRFTTAAYQAPAGFPVMLRLLTESDIARILVNTFLLDGDKSEREPDRDEIDELFRTLGARAGAATPGVSQDDVIETQEYLTKNFGKSAYVAALGEYWDRAIELAPRLSVADRGALFAILWGRHAQFTRLYVRLGEALATLGNPETAFAGLDALVPREDSIIDVKLLGGIDVDGGPTLRLATEQGRQAELPKSDVTALAAELVLPMLESPDPLFEGTDLLDFPGARTRFEKPLEKFLDEASGPLKECILRGKVAYLFDRYVAEQEITSMLLCIPDSNMEVADLPVLIGDWIDHTHGDTPAARAEAACLLFFILTKFDKHLIDSAGSSDDAQTRFERRMQASLLEKFAPMEDSWPKRWTDARAFDNCYWLRNPNFPAEAVIDYEGGREVAFRDTKIDRLTELRDGCVTAPLVREHFREPEAAWDNAMKLNDGGVTYLIESLRPICKQEIKTAQIAGQLAEAAGRLTRTLQRFHVSDDFTERLEAQRAAAQALNMELLTCFQHGHFGALLDAMAVNVDRLADRLRRPPKNIRFVSGGAKPAQAQAQPVMPGGGAMPAGVILPGMPAAAPAAPTPAPAAPAPAAPKPAEDGLRTMTRPDWQAEAAFDYWVETARALANEEDLYARFAITPEAATGMVNELVGAGRRLGLIERISGDLAARDYLERSDKGALAAAMVAAEHLNGFAARSGAAMVDEAERPDVVIAEGQSRKPFAVRKQTDGIADMPEAQAPMMVDYLTDWMHMIHWFYEENARDAAGASKNPEENARLGAILGNLAV